METGYIDSLEKYKNTPKEELKEKEELIKLVELIAKGATITDDILQDIDIATIDAASQEMVKYNYSNPIINHIVTEAILLDMRGE